MKAMAGFNQSTARGANKPWNINSCSQMVMFTYKNAQAMANLSATWFKFTHILHVEIWRKSMKHLWLFFIYYQLTCIEDVFANGLFVFPKRAKCLYSLFKWGLETFKNVLNLGVYY